MHDATVNVDFFKREGYAVLSNAFGQREVEKCLRYLAAARREHKCAVYDLLERDAELFLMLAAHPAILGFCERIMGPFVQLDGLTIVGLPLKDSNGARRVAGWHRDPWAHVPRGPFFTRPLALNALLYLQDLTDEVGPIRVIPRSHRQGITLSRSEERQRHPLEVSLHLNSGDVIVIHNNLVHTGTAPAPEVQERAFVSIFYNLSWLKQTVAFRGPEALRLLEFFRHRGDRRMLRLLGEDETLTERNDTGFLEQEEAQWGRWIKEDEDRLRNNTNAALHRDD